MYKMRKVNALDARKVQPSHLSHRKKIINIFECSADFLYLASETLHSDF